MRRPWSREFATAWVVLCLLVGCACASTEDREPTSRARFPPPLRTGLDPIFTPVLEPLELRLTRGSLIDPTKGYEVSPTGTHVALYAEPSRPFSPAEFVAAIAPSVRATATIAFGRWPGVTSFDLCIEPNPGTDDRAEPEPVVVVDLTRGQFDAIDWPQADAAALVAASRRPGGPKVVVAPSLASDAAWLAVEQRAGELSR